ncbi:NAD(P)-dependent oxidoreductase [Bradyrhizobium guangdongense]|uniref:NAD-dependent epimerase/dehydratase family protein n=1 Tax=Bradyrhizobium guangdongense TaxID=1325090 RepID=UPI00112DF9BF|nr:NAD(P)-dependent oxidoreductase [Bradyrhizobium guangdongense]TPQ27241.1 NAD(P)-dependent oxidoreductase [Bradyrhizobium guangdongense]
MRVLVSGAAGFLGRHVVERLLERGHFVRAIVRPSSSPPEWKGNVEIWRADLRVDGALEGAFTDIDVFVHLAAATSGNEDVQFASTVVGTERALKAMASSSVERLVHISSLVVYDWDVARGEMNEETPLLTDFYRMGGYTIAKMWQERLVTRCSAKNDWQLTILRPGFIWGHEHAEIAGMGRGAGPIHIMFGPFTRLPLTYVRNCADCIAVAVEDPRASGQIFNIVDDDEIRVWHYAREYVRRTKRSRWLLPIPYYFGLGVAWIAQLFSRSCFGSKGKLPSLLTPLRYQQQFKPIRFGNGKLRKVLDWAAPIKFDHCLEETYSKARGDNHLGPA